MIENPEQNNVGEISSRIVRRAANPTGYYISNKQQAASSKAVRGPSSNYGVLAKRNP